MEYENFAFWFLSIRDSILKRFSNLDFFELSWIAILSLILLLCWFFICRKSNFIKVFKNSCGEVTVTRKAFKRLVNNTAMNICGVVWNKAKVRQTRKGLAILVELKIEDTENLSDISERLQNELTELVNNKLGIEKIKTIDVHLSAIKSKDVQPPLNSSTDL